MTLPGNDMDSCIDACNDCAVACDTCAAASLSEDQAGVLAHCIALAIDCAEVCRACAAFMSRGSEFAPMLCGLCAAVCERCAEECERHADFDHCRDGAAACRRCAGECRRIGPPLPQDGGLPGDAAAL